MENPINQLNKLFDSRVRLGILSALMVNDAVNFNDLKELLQITDGNLASHIKALEEWYRMNKATNFTTFYKALKMEALPGYNVMYADRFDTIFYLSNGKIPSNESTHMAQYHVKQLS